MSVSSDEQRSSERPVEIGPPPYYHRSDCHICRKQDGLKAGSELLDAPRPGGYIVEGEYFLAEHAPMQESSAGTVILEARRHLLDFGEMTPAELAEFGSIVHRLVPAVKAAAGVQRVYLLAVMERSPHFHLWLVPKKNEGELRGVAYLAQQPPLTASYSAAEAMSGKIREQFGQVLSSYRRSWPRAGKRDAGRVAVNAGDFLGDLPPGGFVEQPFATEALVDGHDFPITVNAGSALTVRRRRPCIHREQDTNNRAGFVCLGRCPAGRPLRQ
jgi:diadenosine tetraphosphate (Ap4A) HIT family hydrolase